LGIYEKAKIFVLAALCAALLSMPKIVSAQAAITINARAGLRGFCKTDKWLPIHITIENKGADIEARALASYKNSLGGQTASGMDISLPATSRKEFFLYVMPEGLMRNFTVSVMDGNKTLAKTNLNINCLTSPATLLGVIADTPSNYMTLNDIEPMIGTTSLAQLQISDLPDQAQGWAMLDALVVSNVDTGTLTADQKQALELWLAGGGKLFVTGGIQWQATAAGLGDLLPLKPSATKNVNLTSLSAYAMEEETPLEGNSAAATGKLQTGANVLVEQNGTPLLAEKTIGFGKAYYFALDPGLQPLNDWGGMEKIYQSLLAFKSPKPSWANGAWDTYSASSALGTLPELSLPSFLYICGWLGLYIVVIGPVNYFVLRRKKRTELAWVTVPVLAVLFTSMAYFSGYAYRGTQPILNRIIFSQGWQGVEQAQTTALVGIYSPTRTTYNIESRGQLLAYPYPSLSESPQSGNNSLSIKTSEGVVSPDIRVEIGGMKLMGYDGYTPALSIQHDLTYVLSNGTPTLKGSVKNASGYPLKSVAVITSSGWQILGDMPPGKSQKVSLILSNPNSFNATRYALSSQFGWDYLGDKSIEDRRRAEFFNAVFNSYYNIIETNGGVYLLAWVDNDIAAPVTLQGEEISATDSLFHIQKLMPSTQVKTQKWVINSSLYEWESSAGDMLLASPYNFPNGGYNIRFRPSMPIQFSEVSALTLTITTNSGIQQQADPYLWNYQTDDWQRITLDSYGRASVPNAWQYIGIGGELLFNIQGDPNNYFDLSSFDFNLTVMP